VGLGVVDGENSGLQEIPGRYATVVVVSLVC
jgi:hypothetical protein